MNEKNETNLKKGGQKRDCYMKGGTLSELLKKPEMGYEKIIKVEGKFSFGTNVCGVNYVRVN